MCGIAGFCDFSQRSTSDVLEKMTDTLHHRGPDDRGVAFFEAHGAQIGLGHQRLSIIDLSPLGHQPMEIDDGRFRIVYNGEIYNYAEIREELVARGEHFRSHSDTEVILRAFATWGVAAIDRFIGMFAFAIHDRDAGVVTLVRDRAGVKPLYYAWKNQCLLFGSELKAFHPHPQFAAELNLPVLGSFLQHGFIDAPHTIFQHTHKLRPGHYLEVDLRKRSIEEHCYWSVLDAYNKPKRKLALEEAAEELEALLHSAFRYRMVADVPVGVFLSGGYDSSTVAAMLQSQMTDKLRTFTIGFEEPGFDEAPHARAVAERLGTDHVEHYCSRDDAAAIIPKLPQIFDEPFGDVSSIPTYLVSEIARRDVTVALSADGGDETFAGYTKYTNNLDLYRRLVSIPEPLRPALRALLPTLTRLPGIRDIHNIEGKTEVVTEVLAARDPAGAYRNKMEPRYFTHAQLRELLLAKPSPPPTPYDDFDRLSDDNDPLNRMLAIDYQTYMVDDVLVKVDRAAMAVSLEGREPLLDHRIVEFAAQLPSELKFDGAVQKRVMKEVTHRYLPKEIVDRPKMGFGVPIHVWFRDQLRELMLEHLDEKKIAKDGIFDSARVASFRDAYLAGSDAEIDRCWHLLTFQMWKEHWL